jgi:hypothetical protein
MFQVLPVALRHCAPCEHAEATRVHRLAATRCIAARKVMVNILQAAANAVRLQRKAPF